MAKNRKLNPKPPLPPSDNLLHEQLRGEADVSIACNDTIDFSTGVHTVRKSGTIRDSHHSISEPSGCKNPASDSLGKRARAIQNTFAELVPKDLPKPTDANSAEAANRLLARILPGVFVRASGFTPTTVRIVKTEYDASFAYSPVKHLKKFEYSHAQRSALTLTWTHACRKMGQRSMLHFCDYI